MKPSTKAGGASWSTGGPAEHWLHFRDVHLDGYALVTGTSPAMVEMCGGGLRPRPARPGPVRARQRRLVDPRHARRGAGPRHAHPRRCCASRCRCRWSRCRRAPRCATSSRGATRPRGWPRTTRPSPTTPNRAPGARATSMSARANRGSTRRASCSSRSTGGSPRRAGPRSTNCTRTASARSTSSPCTRTSRVATWAASWSPRVWTCCDARVSRRQSSSSTSSNVGARKLYESLGFNWSARTSSCTLTALVNPPVAQRRR